MKVRRVVSHLTEVVCERPAAELRAYKAPARSARQVAEMLPFLRDCPVEQFWCLHLNGKHQVVALEMVSQGTVTSSLVHPREVFGAAVRLGSAAIIVAHNHPSGDPEPSQEDLEVTGRLLRAGELLGIPLLDHVVLGEPGRHVSLRERMPF